MSDHHPYWSYGPDTGAPVVDALNEGRRAFALEKALQSTGFALGDDQAHDRTGEVLANAARIEAFLLGDGGGGVMIGKHHLEALEDAARRLAELEQVPVADGPVRATEDADLDGED